MNNKTKIVLGLSALVGGYVIYTAYKKDSTLTAMQKQRNYIIGTAIIGVAVGFAMNGSISKAIQKVPIPA